MERFVMFTSNKQRFLINQAERDAIIQSVSAGEKMIVIQGELISLQIIPEIVSFERWVVNEENRLANFGKRLCRLCFNAMKDVCQCWPNQSTGKEQNAFFLPKESIKEIAESFQWPNISKTGQALIAEDGGRQSIPNNQLIDGYIDPESGEEIYS